MSPCTPDCPCRNALLTRALTTDERLQIEKNHWPEDKDDSPVEVTPVQGDVHWLDWHDVTRL